MFCADGYPNHIWLSDLHKWPGLAALEWWGGCDLLVTIWKHDTKAYGMQLKALPTMLQA